MKVLLDQNVPRKLERFLPKHEVKHTAQLGWEEIVNGTLLKLAEENGYRALITADKNMVYQNSVAERLIGILSLSTNNWNIMKPHISAIVQAVEEVEPGKIKDVFVGKFVAAKFCKPRGPVL